MLKVEWFHSSVATIAEAYETRGYKFCEQIVLTSDVIAEVFRKGLYQRFQQSEVQNFSESEVEEPRAEPEVDTPVIKTPDTESRAENKVYSRPGPVKRRIVEKPRSKTKSEQEIKLKPQDPGVVLADSSNRNVNYRVVVLENEGKAVSVQVEAPSNDHSELKYRIAPAGDDK